MSARLSRCSLRRPPYAYLPLACIRSFPIHEKEKRRPDKGGRVVSPRTEIEKVGRGERDAKRRRRRRFLQGLHRFLNLLGRTRQLGGDGEGPKEEGGGAGIVAALSEFVRLKIYPMCTVYQTVAVSIGVRARVRVCPLSLYSPSLHVPARLFFKGAPYLFLFLSLSLSRAPWMHALFPRRVVAPSCPFGAI